MASQRICSVEGCGKPIFTEPSGLCCAHYTRQRRHGDPLGGKPSPPPKGEAIERFLDKLCPEPNSGCWLWTGCTNGSGYGHFWYQSRMMAAHRFSYAHYRGAIPDGMLLDHLCRVRCCVNPWHLEVVAHQENCARGESAKATKMRKAAQTHCKNGHPLSGDNLAFDWRGHRRCKTCHRIQTKESARRYRRRKKLA